MEIDIYSDVVCPWCYIGKRRLEQALESYDGDVTIRFRPFQLDPTPVDEPRPLVDALAAKFGGPERARQIFEHTTATAAQSGLTLHFDRAVNANTFDAHRLVWFADTRGRAAEMIDALYQAHFTEGVDVGSRAALAALAGRAGLDESEAREFLDSSAGEAEVRAEIDGARQLGVTSVPTFVFAGKYAVTGAQEPETLRAVLDEVTRREAADKAIRPLGQPGGTPAAGECTDDACAV
ncbi:Predicted dithiol-disulfide isomerase, DsbA family [Micromonospora pattaloongensis]|uniref:Predicted dithiol-disulfide isomerase, DsbA family n=1 Tax=Micromonospora pattaloongensis TaxID=405436 RepID=A0A1H3HZ23_9ACTN|nr:DsbA family oxidoreductase [Micromonospora pattaloongensis]SDY20078.1 Predicted dithiol-disulfide isomerase, DsbA family [Micromonospora pattaloongensis]